MRRWLACPLQGQRLDPLDHGPEQSPRQMALASSSQ